jgi:adenosyl cobinamide kinase/adenosyl cobinamide phosphate guanylyltransferase
VTVELSKVLPQLEAAQVDVNIRVSAKLKVTKVAARRKVNVFVLNEIGTGLGGDTPTLVIYSDRVCWCVPVIMAPSPKGRLGQVGHIDVDAQTGEILADDQLIQDIADHAERLVAGSSL